MNFMSWIFRRIKNSQSDWVRGYRRLILEETFLSIVTTAVVGVFCWLAPLGWICIHFIDQHATAELTLVVLALAVPLFYVYHWIMALHEVYELEKQKTWEALKR
jgi:hypothetical protein